MLFLWGSLCNMIAWIFKNGYIVTVKSVSENHWRDVGTLVIYWKNQLVNYSTFLIFNRKNVNHLGMDFPLLELNQMFGLFKRLI